MTKKQGIWLIVAAALFALTGWLGVQQAKEANRLTEERTGALVEEMFSSISGKKAAEGLPGTPYVAKLSVEGTISSAAPATSYLQQGVFDLAAISDTIDRYIADENNVGLLLYIDSPGGEMGASDVLYCKLMDYKQTERPIFCYFGSTACSGGYYVAMPADEIYADRNCICVNIGVYISTYNFSGLMEKYGVEQVNIKSSENKGIGLSGTPWTEEQLAIYQSIVDLYYEQFLQVVAEGRDMTVAQVKKLNDGREMLAAQALEAGFIDGVCRYEEYESRVMDQFTAGTLLYEPGQGQSVLNSLFNYIDSVMPRSDTSEILNMIETHSGIVVMAYAN